MIKFWLSAIYSSFSLLSILPPSSLHLLPLPLPLPLTSLSLAPSIPLPLLSPSVPLPPSSRMLSKMATCYSSLVVAMASPLVRGRELSRPETQHWETMIVSQLKSVSACIQQ